MDTESVQVRLQKLKEVTDVLLKADISVQDAYEGYRKWATSVHGSYEELNDPSAYSSPKKVAAFISGLFPKPESTLILDIGAGPGITGDMLTEKGFTNLHALEPVKEFADICESKKIYHKVFNVCIGRGSDDCCPNESYDAIVASGSFAPGCIPCDALYAIVRLLKPGGYFVNCMRKEYLWTVPEYKDRLEPLINQLEREGRWKKVAWEIYPNHFFDKDGIVMVFQRC